MDIEQIRKKIALMEKRIWKKQKKLQKWKQLAGMESTESSNEDFRSTSHCKGNGTPPTCSDADSCKEHLLATSAIANTRTVADVSVSSLDNCSLHPEGFPRNIKLEKSTGLEKTNCGVEVNGFHNGLLIDVGRTVMGKIKDTICQSSELSNEKIDSDIFDCRETIASNSDTSTSTISINKFDSTSTSSSSAICLRRSSRIARGANASGIYDGGAKPVLMAKSLPNSQNGRTKACAKVTNDDAFQLSSSSRPRIFPRVPDQLKNNKTITDFELADEMFIFVIKSSESGSPSQSPRTQNPSHALNDLASQANLISKNECRGVASPDSVIRPRNSKSRADSAIPASFTNPANCVSKISSSTLLPNKTGPPEMETTLCFEGPASEPIEVIHYCKRDDVRIIMVGQRSSISIWISERAEESCYLLKKITLTLNYNDSWRFDGFCTATDVGILLAEDSREIECVKFFGFSLERDEPYSAVSQISSSCTEGCRILSCPLDNEFLIYAHTTKSFTCIKKYQISNTSVKCIQVLKKVEDRLNSVLKVAHLTNAVIGSSLRNIYFWNHCSGELVKTLQTGTPIQDCCFSKIETAFLFLVVAIFNESNATYLQLLINNPLTSAWKTTAIQFHSPIGTVQCPLKFANSGSRLAAITSHGGVCVWDIVSGDVVALIDNCGATSVSMFVNHQSKSLLVVGDQFGNVNTFKLVL